MKKIEKLFVLTCGEVDSLYGGLCAEGIHQSKIVSAKIASMAGTKTVTMLFPNYEGPIKETGKIVFFKVQEKSKLIMPQYVDDRKMNNVWRILDAIYTYQDTVVILVMCSSSINQLLKYFCDDNGITFPSPSDRTIGYCRGYEVDCKNKKCTSIDWSRATKSN